MTRTLILTPVTGTFVLSLVAWALLPSSPAKRTQEKRSMLTTSSGLLEALPRSESEWRQLFAPEQFHILRRKGTERAFTGVYGNSEKQGIYRCAACGQTLFDSDTKLESGTPWPGFWQPIDETRVALYADDSWFTRRTEVAGSRCDGHLGHVLSDGPVPTGLRYCINSAALRLDESHTTS